MTTPATVTPDWRIAYDCMGSKLAAVEQIVGEHAQFAGYVTGTGDVPWSAMELDAHPGVVRIDQSPVNTSLDETADVLDFENGAATLATLVPWCHAALASYRTGKRPGQRSPLVYASASTLTTVANALVTAGLVNGEIGFYVAHWGVSEAAAIVALNTAGGNWPIQGFQFASKADYDIDVFDGDWLTTVSKAPDPDPPAPAPVPKATAESLTITYSDKTTKVVPL